MKVFNLIIKVIKISCIIIVSVLALLWVIIPFCLISINILEKWGVKNSNGDLLIPCEYDQIVLTYDPNLFVVKKHELWGVVDVNNKIILPIKYKQVISRPENLFLLRFENKNITINNNFQGNIKKAKAEFEKYKSDKMPDLSFKCDKGVQIKNNKVILVDKNKENLYLIEHEDKFKYYSKRKSVAKERKIIYSHSIINIFK